jgi:ATP phosphoribosyltransferase
MQVALGNYDVGICNLTWVKEIAARFPTQPIAPLCDLEIGPTALWAAAADGRFSSLDQILELPVVRIASEFPNLAEAFAVAARLPRYRVQAVWGSAEGYPPEDADVVVVSAERSEDLVAEGLVPLHCLLDGGAWLIANETSLRTRSLGEVLQPMLAGRANSRSNGLRLPPALAGRPTYTSETPRRESLRLAIPDGHQQRHVVSALEAAGLRFGGYDSAQCVRRPSTEISGLEIKVVRPHDMPQLAALGQIDLGITGRDCLMEHLYRFPSSPVQELMDLERGQYNLCAVVTEDLAAETIEDALAYWRSQGKQYVRVASEFPGTADYYARSRHIWRYQVIPIAGASEGFVPEDAELLIEGTETGTTLRENRLKPIDLLYRSTTCVIGHKEPELSEGQADVHAQVVTALRRSVGAG